MTAVVRRALGAAYTGQAPAAPDLHRAMFDTRHGPDDAAAATRIWSAGHGMLSLGVPGREVLVALAPDTLTDRCAGLGDVGARAAVTAAWRFLTVSRDGLRLA